MRALGVLVTAPIPGRVKPRLSEDIGPSGAAEVYWRLGRQVVGAVAGSGYRTTVWFTPSGEGPFVREWLEGLGRVLFRPQAGASPADRLRAAFAREFADGASRVVLTQCDCPGLTRRVVLEAFAGLGGCDVVLGPAVDGGAYLVGLVRPQPTLLIGTAWTTPAASAQLQSRARALGLTCHTLRPLRRVESARDARAVGFLNY